MRSVDEALDALELTEDQDISDTTAIDILVNQVMQRLPYHTDRWEHLLNETSPSDSKKYNSLTAYVSKKVREIQ